MLSNLRWATRSPPAGRSRSARRESSARKPTASTARRPIAFRLAHSSGARSTSCCRAATSASISAIRSGIRARWPRAKQAALLGLRGIAFSAPSGIDDFTSLKPWMHRVLDTLIGASELSARQRQPAARSARADLDPGIGAAVRRRHRADEGSDGPRIVLVQRHAARRRGRGHRSMGDRAELDLVDAALSRSHRSAAAGANAASSARSTKSSPRRSRRRDRRRTLPKRVAGRRSSRRPSTPTPTN